MRRALPLLLALFVPLVHAHPGEHHGNVIVSLWHLVSEPDHLAMLAVAVLLGVAGAKIWRRKARQSLRSRDRQS